ncbi:MAG: biotin/lipoyl-binding protein [Planctomycetota bacterium]
MVSAADIRQRLGAIRIGLRRDLAVSRQIHCGQASYVVHDPLTFKNALFSAEEYRVLCGIIESRSLEETLQHLIAIGDLEEADADAFFRFVLNLHHMNLLQLPITDSEKLFERFQKRQAVKRKALLGSVMYYKVPLWDPDKFLDKTMRVAAPLFSRIGVVAWASLMLFTVWTCWGRFGEFLGDTTALLQWSNVPILYVVLVALKAVHEFGHAYVCKKLGGAVPEMGVCFIMTTPCAYVDASSSWKFRSKWDRIAVAMGGMYIESMVAALAALVWVGTSPGLTHDVALNVVSLAGVVTVLFNINPLMRFDGYYAFTDLTSTPNLRERSTAFIRDWSKSLFLGHARAKQTLGWWYRTLYGGYGVASVIYKLVLAFSITYLMTVRWPLVGAVLGSAFGFVLIVKPVLKLVSYLLFGKETEPMRRRAIAVAALGLVLAPAILVQLPISRAVVVPGLLEPEQVLMLRAPHDAEIQGMAIRHGELVRPGQLLASLDHPELRLQHQQEQRRLEAERVRLSVVEAVDQVEAERIRARLAFLESAFQDIEERLHSMTVTATEPAVVADRGVERQSGRFVRLGEPLLELHSGQRLIHAVLPEDELSRLDLEVGSSAEIRWAVAPSERVLARVREVRPVASRSDMPEPLTMLGGGDVYVRQGAEGEVEAATPHVHIFLEPESVPRDFTSGLTARVRLAARSESLGAALWKSVQRFYQAWKTS